jgi:hypothetical protein
MDRRLQVPQLNLRQGKNELRLNGELTLPGTDQKWWQGDFNANVDAKIEKPDGTVSVASPGIKYAAARPKSRVPCAGAARSLTGNCSSSGSKLTWRNAPIETLHAAIKLNGKEIQIANVELINQDDYLRGRGLVKLVDPPVYWGELRLTVDDLANYTAFLQKPVLPEPLAGGAIIDWTGEGSKVGHSGKFLARLRKVRTLGAMAQSLHPINAELEADYAPGSMQFSRFVLSDDDSSFTANVAVGNKALNLQGIRLTHKGAVQLQGRRAPATRRVAAMAECFRREAADGRSGEQGPTRGRQARPGRSVFAHGVEVSNWRHRGRNVDGGRINQGLETRGSLNCGPGAHSTRLERQSYQ